MGKNLTQTNTFFFVDALSGLIHRYPVFQTNSNMIFLVFVLNYVKFTIKKDPHGEQWLSNNTTMVVPRAAVEGGVTLKSNHIPNSTFMHAIQID